MIVIYCHSSTTCWELKLVDSLKKAFRRRWIKAMVLKKWRKGIAETNIELTYRKWRNGKEVWKIECCLIIMAQSMYGWTNRKGFAPLERGGEGRVNRTRSNTPLGPFDVRKCWWFRQWRRKKVLEGKRENSSASLFLPITFTETGTNYFARMSDGRERGSWGEMSVMIGAKKRFFLV